MAKIGKILLAILILGGIFIFPVSSQSLPLPQWTRADLQKIYMDYLRQEGYMPSVDVDGDIKFKVAGDSYFIIIDENDLQFFQVYRGFSLGAISQEKALNAANYSNRHSKVVKISLSSDGKIVSITAELLLNTPKDFIPVFSRVISLIQIAENNFMEQVK